MDRRRYFVAEQPFDVVPPGDDPEATKIERGEHFQFEHEDGVPTIIHKGKRIRTRVVPIKGLLLKGWARELPAEATTVVSILDLCVEH